MLAADLDTPSTVIPNTYRAGLFRRLPGMPRSRDLISWAGWSRTRGPTSCSRRWGLLAAAGLARASPSSARGRRGPAWKEQASRLGLADRIDFAGLRTGEELVRLLNEHRILVVPSRYDKPFGIVALEGIAWVRGGGLFSGGGLPEAIGACGTDLPQRRRRGPGGGPRRPPHDARSGDGLTRHAAATSPAMRKPGSAVNTPRSSTRP